MTTAKNFQDTVAANFNQAVDAIKNAANKIEVPEAARDFVKRSASTAKTRAEEAHEGANNVTARIEKALTTIVNGGANITRNLLQAGHENLVHTLATVEKVAAAKSPKEAFEIQTNFAREYTRINFGRVRDAAEAVQVQMTDGAKALQGEIAKILPSRKAA
jgi:hypothetical protein